MRTRHEKRRCHEPDYSERCAPRRIRPGTSVVQPDPYQIRSRQPPGACHEEAQSRNDVPGRVAGQDPSNHRPQWLEDANWLYLGYLQAGTVGFRTGSTLARRGNYEPVLDKHAIRAARGRLHLHVDALAQVAGN
jgi:hypothetical protein